MGAHYRLTIYFSVITYVAMTGILYFRHPTIFDALQANLFAGSIDTLVAVFVIDLLNRALARKETYGYRFNAYLEATSIFNGYFHLWATILVASRSSNPTGATRLFSAEHLNDIFEHFDATKPIGGMQQLICQTTSWPVYLQKTMRKNTSRIDSWKKNYGTSDLFALVSAFERLYTSNMLEHVQHEGKIAKYHKFEHEELPIMEALYGQLRQQTSLFRQEQGFVEPFDMFSIPPNLSVQFMVVIGGARRD